MCLRKTREHYLWQADGLIMACLWLVHPVYGFALVCDLYTHVWLVYLFMTVHTRVRVHNCLRLRANCVGRVKLACMKP